LLVSRVDEGHRPLKFQEITGKVEAGKVHAGNLLPTSELPKRNPFKAEKNTIVTKAYAKVSGYEQHVSQPTCD